MRKEDCQRMDNESEKAEARFVYSYRGVSSMYGYCDGCGRPFSYLIDRRFIFCPFCRARLIDEQKEDK